MPDAAPDEAAAGSGAERPTAADAAAWAGHKLDDVGGAPVGRVEGGYLDAADGSLEWLLARMGRFGHRCLVPARHAVAAVERIWVPYTREQIREAPRLEQRGELTKEQELALLRHYGSDAGERAEALAGRGETAITLRPG